MCTGGRAGVLYVITKFSLMDSLPHFVTHGAPLRARFARARASILFFAVLLAFAVVVGFVVIQ